MIQPIGVFPPPAAFLLLPPSDHPDSLSALLNGDLSAPLPGEWQFFSHAAQGQIPAAVHLLSSSTEPLTQYNLFVLEGGDIEAYRKLELTLPQDLRALLQVVAFQSGLINELPLPDSLYNESKAALLLCRAGQRLEHNETSQAISDLESAVDCVRSISPIFAAQLLGQLANLKWHSPGLDSSQAINHYRDALQLANDTPLPGLRAELWLNLGSCYQDHSAGRRDYLTQAIHAYQAAVHSGLSETAHPEMYALAQNNLGLAYLTMPLVEASDGLRKAIAVQSFREALKVYQPETHRLEWVSAKLNLANALQYLPSSHPEENLLQAVEIYEELLQTRSRAEDPVGYARLLANQATALAHLGLFSQSLEKANEAYKLFHWHNETDAASSVLELVATVHENLGAKKVTA